MHDPLILSPSRAARRVACPGSHFLEAKYPNVETESSREGTAAHWVAEEILHDHPIPELGSFTPNDEIVTQEMIDGAELYRRHIEHILLGWDETLRQRGGLNKCVFIEQKLIISDIHPMCEGTPDCWVFLDNLRQLHIWDYKFGYTPISPEENWQLIEYAAGVLQKINEYRINYALANVDSIHFHIVQPRDYRSLSKIKTWAISVDKLLPYFNILRKAENEATKPNAICRPNSECNYCRARHTCPALNETALIIADAIMQNTPDNLNNEELGAELRYLEYAQQRLSARITGIKEQVLNKLRSGKRIPFYQLDTSRPRERWTKSPEIIAKLGDLFGINLRKTPDVITPQQAIKAGLPEDIIKENSERPPGEFKVIPINMQK